MMLRQLKPLLKRWVKRGGRQMISAGGRLTSALEGKEWHEYKRDGLYTNHRPKLLDDQDFQNALQPVIEHSAFGKAGPLPLSRLHLLWQLVRTCEGVSGDTR